ncbi:mucin-1 [Heteronotia binoei]|uniref:mucin-1 n=1 Tax=Heteronotia binoei TaxID=13085 RepID=UPI00292D3E9B|nr:mucin-1 [Heteronotia binoei]
MVSSTTSTTEGTQTTTSSQTTMQAPSSVTSKMTTSTTPIPVPFYLSYHITNREFNESLLDPTSSYFKEINESIGQMISKRMGGEPSLSYVEQSYSKSGPLIPGNLGLNRDLPGSSTLDPTPESSTVNTESPTIITTTTGGSTGTPEPTITVSTTPGGSTTSTEPPTTISTTPGGSTAIPEPPITVSTTPRGSTATPEKTTASSKTTTLVGSTTSNTEGTQRTTTRSQTTTSSVTSQMTTSTTQMPVPFYLSYHITNREFNESLLDPASTYYQAINDSIGMMYQNIYGCLTCARNNEYRGYKIIAFRNGSVSVDSVLYFETEEPPKVLAMSARDTFENATEAQRENFTVGSIQGSSTPPTLEPPTANTESPGTETTTQESPTASTETTTPVSSDGSTKSPSTSTTPPKSSTTSTESTTSHKTTPTTPTFQVTTQKPTSAMVSFFLSYLITNREFDDTLLYPTSSYYKQINDSIGKMYQNIYGCPKCTRKNEYRGYEIVGFRKGSIRVWSVLFFETEQSSEELAVAALETFEKADPSLRDELSVTSARGSSAPMPIPDPPAPVPGYGIALLVLVAILLLLAIIAFLLLIIYRCRRNHRGRLDLLHSQESYHPMSEYPTYHTHGRYAAPVPKSNLYSEKPPTNGTSPFSYTNPAMANDNL